MKKRKDNNKNKLKLFADLFKHKFKGKEMTYIFIIDSNKEIKRARVPIKNGLPKIEKNLDWQNFFQI